jgi:hypothetical protein
MHGEACMLRPGCPGSGGGRAGGREGGRRKAGAAHTHVARLRLVNWPDVNLPWIISLIFLLDAQSHRHLTPKSNYDGKAIIVCARAHYINIRSIPSQPNCTWEQVRVMRSR